MDTRRSFGYRTNAAPALGFALGTKPGPTIARGRFGPGYALCFLLLVAVLGTFARLTPESTFERMQSSFLFGAVYTFSVLGLVGFVTLAFLRFTLREGAAPRLSLDADRLCIGRPEGALEADVGAVRAVPIQMTHDARARVGLELRFPSGDAVRIVLAAEAERAELDDPWDYTLEEQELAELRRRLVPR